MRWSIKSMLLYTLAFAVCLTLCFLPRVELGGAGVAAVLAMLRPVLNQSQWRHVFWGTAAGANVAIIVLTLYVMVQSGKVSLGLYGADPLPRPLVYCLFPMGGFVGGSIGLLTWQLMRNSQ